MSQRIAVAVLLAFSASGVPAAEVPRRDGRVTDLGAVLSPDDEARLERELEEYAKKTGHGLAILVVKDLGGQSLEQLALEVGREWKLGRPGLNDGAVLLVAHDERRIRIEVGRGLEGVLTDSISGRIIRDIIVPRFRAGDFFGGLLAGVQAMQAAIGGEALPVARRTGVPPGLLVAIIFFVILITLASARRRRGRRGGTMWLPGPLASPFGRSRSGSSGWGGFGGGGFGGGVGGGSAGFGGGGFSGGGASGRW